ncbi:MAG: hypothetical protein AAFV59_08340 [Pseudomonadota bacterium]
MKFPAASFGIIAAFGLMSGCVSNNEYDRDRAYSQCDGISDASSRNRCIADAIQDAERERHEQAKTLERYEENAEKRELGREIAGAEPN